MNRLFFFVIAFILIFSFGCKSPKSATNAGANLLKDTTASSGIADIRLHNIWVVEIANGLKLVPGEYANGLPVLELFVMEKRVGGNDGCNQIGGSFTATGNTISFSHLTGTKMACPGMEKGIRIGVLLSGKSYQYVFEKNHLLLKQDGREVLVLKNID